MKEAYALAQHMLLADKSVANAVVYPHWCDNGAAFWYERKGAKGREYVVIDAPSGDVKARIERQRIVAALEETFGAPIDDEKLMLKNLAIDAGRASFTAFGQAFEFDVASASLRGREPVREQTWLPCPAGNKALLLKDSNLWVRDLSSGEERALTHDGAEEYAYASPPLAMRAVRQRFGGLRPEASWSPDGRFVLTLQTDDRSVGALPFMDFAPADSIRPRVTTNKTSLPGDVDVTRFRMVVLDLASDTQIEVRYPLLHAVRMNDSPFSAGLTWWSKDAKTAYFVDIERGEQKANVVAVDAETGASRVVFSATDDAYVELSVNVYAPALVYPLTATNELVWYSERSGRGHLYLYDLTTGALKRAITAGEWQVREVLHVDAKRREVFFMAAGIAPEEDPYICKPCVVSLDGGATRVVSAERGEHIVWRAGEFGLMVVMIDGLDPNRIAGLSPNGDYFVETVGSVDAMPRTILRTRQGELITLLEQADAHDLPAGWSWPEPVHLKAADRETDIYGIVLKPPGYDPTRSYPIIDYIYGGPQVSITPKIAFGNAFATAPLLNAAHLAALGAFVVVLDGRGTANRERAFRTASHRRVHTASDLEDHVAGIKELAGRYPAMDLSRVGICGFSGGGYMTAMAATRFGNFFKVAVAGGGNYDQSLFWHTWGERYHGAFEAEHYAAQAVKTYAGGLSGKLLLIHGMLDSGCHPAALMQLIQALIEANKDYDLVVLPRAGHELTGYGVRRQLDYFTTHLIGANPPKDVKITLSGDGMAERFAYNAAPPTREARP